MGQGKGKPPNNDQPPPTYTEVEEIQNKTYLKKDPRVEELTQEVDKQEGDKSKSKKPSIPPVGLLELFKFSSPTDAFLIVFSIIVAFASGSMLPVSIILFGDTLQAFVDYELFAQCQVDGVDSRFSPMTVLTDFLWQMIVLGTCVWMGAFIFISSLNTVAARQVFKIRGEFLRAVLRQDIAWYDTTTTNDFASRMTDDLNKLQEGIGEKIGMLFYFLGCCSVSIVIAFLYGWELTLVLLCIVPILSVSTAVTAKITTSLAERELTAYAKAGAIAEEALSGIRTVVAFGGQQKEADRFVGNLAGARRAGILRGMLTGLSGGVTFGIIFSVYGLGFWYGVKLIMDDKDSDECKECFMGNETDPNFQEDVYDCLEGCVRYDAKALLTVFFSVIWGGFQIGQAAPYIEAISMSRGAAALIYSIIDRVPNIDSSSNLGKKPGKIVGNIEMKNIVFSYPARPDVEILRGLSLSIPAGKTVALVGTSGCGKSTCIQLVQRFYDPLKGAVLLDNFDIRELNVGWLRDNIGVVGQEPVLFDCTIKENIRFGRMDASDADIEKACREANAYDFIMDLPYRYDTMVGERGAQLSGGQKQRIAIARALVRNPQILLLDEATSALDNESESLVQAALERASSGRTTIVVAHRLSTIRTADHIIALDQGVVSEEGSHDQLMEKRGLYYNLVMRQLTGSEAESKEDDKEGDGNNPDTSQDRSKQRNQTMSASPEENKSLAEDEGMDGKVPKIQISRLLGSNLPEWPYITLGILASCAIGGAMPVFSILFGDVNDILSYTDTQKARDESVFYLIMFGVLGLASFLASFTQGTVFGISGENLTQRLRKQSFEAMLRQEIGWFDRKENSTGALCAKLSGDASKVQGATGARVGLVVQGIAAMIIAVVIGLLYDWKLGLVSCIFFPFLIVGTLMEFKITLGVDSLEKQSFEDSAKLAIEAITNIRTVAGLRCENRYTNEYISLLAKPHALSKTRALKRGVIFGFTQALQFYAWGVTLFYGGYLVVTECLKYAYVYTVTNSIIGGAQMIGYSFAFTADFNKALVAASRIFSLLDRKSEIDANPSIGLRLGRIEGNIDLKDAVFSYPTRPSVQVLKGLDMNVSAGRKVALVGSSGCGKSTIIQLIQRFYDVDSGSVNVEGTNIQSLNVPHLRAAFGIVSQEPTLFDLTIAENIQFGDNSRTVSMEEVLAAARKANIHNFVSSLPEGYQTRVGSKGTQLSGGQKQRIAIARALVRNPRVLLLDEATSALDMESEKIVQEALDAAQEGRTSITIAHRLSTIKDSDKIIVFNQGLVDEEGTHEELLEAQGTYYRLWNSSN